MQWKKLKHDRREALAGIEKQSKKGSVLMSSARSLNAACDRQHKGTYKQGI